MVLYLFLALVMAAAAMAALGGGDVQFRVTGAGSVMFRHDSHVSSHGLACKACHYHLYTTVAGHSKMTMKDMEQGRSCGACHNGVQAFDVRANCNRCHIK